MRLVNTHISPREQEVLDELIQGHKVTTIAKKLCISNHTCRMHIRNIAINLGLHDFEDVDIGGLRFILRRCLELGWIEWNPPWKQDPPMKAISRRIVG